MLDASLFPQSIQTILITRLDGLDDIVLGTMLLSGLHRRWPGAYIKILVRPQMAGVSAILPKWVRVIPLPFDPRQPIAGNEIALAEQLRALAEDCQADITILAEYQRIWAAEMLASLANSDLVLSFDGPTGLSAATRSVAEQLELPELENWQRLRVEKDARETAKQAMLLDALGIDPVGFLPGGLIVRPEDQNAADALWAETGLPPRKTIILFPGRGTDLTRTLVPPLWERWAANVSDKYPVMMLGSDLDQQVLDDVAQSGLREQVKRVALPVDRVGVLAALLDTSAAYIGTSGGPMHIAASLGRPTLGVFGGGHRGERFLPVGRKAAAVRMPLGCFGCDWECPFDTKLCLSHMPWELLLATGEEFIDKYVKGGTTNENPLLPQVYDLPASADLPSVLLGPMMRMHRAMNRFRGDVHEHNDFMARVNQDRQGRISEMGDALSSITNILSEMARQNRTRDDAIQQIKTALSILVQQSQNGPRQAR
jgi:ADP-heptose:LPS heptosyltransferase